MFKRILIGIGGALLLLIVIVLIKTLTFKSKQLQVAVETLPDYTAEALPRLQGAIKFKTISNETQFDSSQFNGFHRYLRSTYPLVHEKLSLKKIAGYSLLYKWEGTDASLPPYVLMAHQDVVPVEEASKDLWIVDPFEGLVKQDSIWGRGVCDDKINLIGIMETVEKLLKEGFQPKRTVYLAFGHDEEVGGLGAQATEAELISQTVNADLVLDEGGIVTLDKVPGMTKPVALIGTSEKGYVSLELKVEKKGGHSSMPENETALDILTRAVVTLREHPFPARFTPSTEGFLEYVGPEMPFGQRIVFANTWLFKKIVIGIYESSPGGNALVRTTSVPTIFNAGVAGNVVPTTVAATFNFRTLPGDSTAGVVEYVKKSIGDERVQISIVGGFRSEPTAITSPDGPGYKIVDETVHKVFPETVTAPFMMIGGTDSRYMKGVSKNIIKFSPMTDPVGFHGINERVSVNNFRDTLWFFETLLRNAK
ncbi:MAG TPA: M20 family peptidase [Cyclobacteriaceae bacterium]